MKTREEIKEVAVEMVRSHGLINLSRRELCERAGIPDGSFPHIMGCNFAQLVEELSGEHIVQNMASVSKSRTSAALRKENILSVAVELAVEVGYYNITRDAVAAAAGVSFGLVSKYFGTMTQLKNDVMRRAIKQETLSIIAQGLANGDKRAKNAPLALRTAAVGELM